MTAGTSLPDPIQADRKRSIGVITVGEIISLAKRRFGDIKKIEAIGRTHSLGITILSSADALVFQTAEFDTGEIEHVVE